MISTLSSLLDNKLIGNIFRCGTWVSNGCRTNNKNDNTRNLLGQKLQKIKVAITDIFYWTFKVILA